MGQLIEQDGTVLFQGDSITDAGRDYADDGSLGYGYALMVAGLYGATHPCRKVHFINRGISGHRVVDLADRWQRDTIDLRPSLVSIMIGINDCWRRYDSNDPTSVESFEEGYRDLLRQIQSQLGSRIVLIEPFLLPVSPDMWRWREDLDPKICAVRRLAAEFGTVLVPADALFAAAMTTTGPAYWARDGVHPTAAGHALLAREWLRAVGAGRACRSLR